MGEENQTKTEGNVVVQRQEGFGWKYSEERTVRIPGADPKYADTVIRKAELSGNSMTFTVAENALEAAKAKVLDMVTK